jgi:hypothetical protein
VRALAGAAAVALILLVPARSSTLDHAVVVGYWFCD